MLHRLLPLLLLPVALLRAADPEHDSAAVITGLAASLTAGNLQLFIEPFEPAMPGYGQLRSDVSALMAQGETQSFIEVTKNEGDGRARTIEASWELRVPRGDDATPSSRRQVQVVCKLELRGKRWRIVAFSPLDFLAP